MAATAKILVVDDEPYNVDLLEQELELLGYATVAAMDGRDALDALAREAVDLVLLDVMMPRLDGYEVLRRIKADPALRHLPVIMVSALDQLESAVRCIELGAEDYLPKPFEPVLLRARVAAGLERKRWHDREAAYRRQIEEQLRVIEAERRRAEDLLHVVLPAAAVAELKRSDGVPPRRHDDVTAVDLSRSALQAVRDRMGDAGKDLRLEVGDVLDLHPDRTYALWHDRAVFHFLTERADRDAYRASLGRSLRRHGWVVVSTFGPQGPDTCSGLPVMRYDHQQLAREFPGHELVSTSGEDHQTPWGCTQQFTAVLLRRRA